MNIDKKTLAEKAKEQFDKSSKVERHITDLNRELYRVIVKGYTNIMKAYKVSEGYDFDKLRLDLSNGVDTELLNKIDDLTKTLAGQEVKLVEELLVEAFRDNALRLGFNVQMKIGYEIGMFDLSDETVKQLVNARWTKDGKNYIDRLSEGNQKTAKRLKNIVTDGLTKGVDPRKTANKLRDATNAKLSSARTLVRTETNSVVTQSDNKTYRKLGFEEYEFSAEYDARTTDICGDMDGERFPISEMMIGVNAPPMHPNCRSTINPVNIIDYKPPYRYGDDGFGNRIKVDSDMSYQEFKKQHL